MSYFLQPTARWFSGTLCRRYLVVRTARLSLPMLEGPTADTQWHWALGFHRDNQFQVLGAWQDDGEGGAQRIATDLRHRGIERVNAVAAEDDLLEAMDGLRPRLCKNTTAELVASGALGSRMRRAVCWTEVAGVHLQGRLSRGIKRAKPFANQAAAADFIARAFQRVSRELLEDRWERLGRKRSAKFGQDAFIGYRSGAA